MDQYVNNLEYNVAQLLKESIGSLRDCEVESAGLDLDDVRSGTIKGKVKLLRTNRSILVEAWLKTSVKIECSRCLRELLYPLKIQMEEEYFPTIDIISGRPLPPPDDPGGFTIDENHILDLSEAASQYLLMALPMKPLCKEDCAGLCPACGRDLNQGRCDCPASQPDPRWAKLARLAVARGADK